MDVTEIGIQEDQTVIAAPAHVLTETAEMTDTVLLLLLTGEVAVVVQAVVVAGAIEDLLPHHWPGTDLILLVEGLLCLLCLLLIAEDGMHRFLIDHTPELDLVEAVAVAAEEVMTIDATIALIHLKGEKEVPPHGWVPHPWLVQLRKEVHGGIRNLGTAAVVAVVHRHPTVNLSSRDRTELVQPMAAQPSTDPPELPDLAPVATGPLVLLLDLQVAATTDLHLQQQGLLQHHTVGLESPGLHVLQIMDQMAQQGQRKVMALLACRVIDLLVTVLVLGVLVPLTTLAPQ